MKASKIIKLLLSLILNPFAGAEGESGDEESEKDLQKSLDDNLEAMSKLIKSESGETVEDLVKTEEGRAKIKALLAKSDDSDDEEDEEDEEYEEGERYMKKGGKYMKSGKGEYMYKGGKMMKYGDMKKSLDDAIETHEQVLDAVPVMQDFAKTLGKVIDGIAMVKSEIDDLRDKADENANLQKSLAAVVQSEAELLKSANETIEAMAGEPGDIKGLAVKGKKGLLQKSFGLGEGGDVEPTVSVPLVKSILLKSFEEGRIQSGEISKWEMSGYRLGALSEGTRALIKSKVGGNND